MLYPKDNSGQVMLTNAIMFAVIIIAISLMLNNIIFATNVAYIGFMDGTKYEDLSIRQMTTKEATCAFQNYLPNPADPLDEQNVNLRATYMGDYIKAINNLTNSKGKYVEVLNRYYPPPNPPSYLGLKVTQTQWDLVIRNKDSEVTYNINTGSTNLSAPYPPTTLQKPAVSFTDEVIHVNEGDTCTVRIELDHPYTQDITVSYRTVQDSPLSSDSALDGVNFNSEDVTITVPANQLGISFPLTTKYDDSVTGTLNYTVEIYSTSGNAVIGSPASATICVDDIDTTATPTPAPLQYDLRVDCAAIRDNAGNKKDVIITTVITNIGISTLSNVNLTLILPTGKSFVSGASPTVNTTPMIPGATWTIVWVIQTQNQNDYVNVQVKAAATEFAIGKTSQIQMDI